MCVCVCVCVYVCVCVCVCVCVWLLYAHRIVHQIVFGIWNFRFGSRIFQGRMRFTQRSNTDRNTVGKKNSCESELAAD